MSSKLNLADRCYEYMCGGAVREMLMQSKSDMVSFAGNSVIRM